MANLRAALATPQQAEPPVKDHEIRDAVSALTEVAKTYHAQQQLRERIAQVVLPLMERAGWKAPAERFTAEPPAAADGLPELPEDPEGTVEVDCGPAPGGGREVMFEDGYSAAQMRAYAREALAAVEWRAAARFKELEWLRNRITALNGWGDDALAAKPAQEALSEEPPIGSYVLATKYGDGDPGDPWAIGFYTRSDPIGSSSRRFYVADSAGNNIRGNGFRRIVGPIRRDVGRWLLEVAARQLEQSPPGAVNLLTMLTANAFDLEQDSEQAHGIKKDGTT